MKDCSVIRDNQDKMATLIIMSSRAFEEKIEMNSFFRRFSRDYFNKCIMEEICKEQKRKIIAYFFLKEEKTREIVHRLPNL